MLFLFSHTVPTFFFPLPSLSNTHPPSFQQPFAYVNTALVDLTKFFTVLASALILFLAYLPIFTCLSFFCLLLFYPIIPFSDTVFSHTLPASFQYNGSLSYNLLFCSDTFLLFFLTILFLFSDTTLSSLRHIFPPFYSCSLFIKKLSLLLKHFSIFLTHFSCLLTHCCLTPLLPCSSTNFMLSLGKGGDKLNHSGHVLYKKGYKI